MNLPLQLGRYRLVAPLGAGGMGQVYRAVAEGAGGIERPACIKLLRSGLLASPELQRRFEDESRLSFLLNHANIVTVYDVGSAGELSYIAMELVEGCDLGQLLLASLERQRTPLPLAHALYAIREAAKGLDYAHRRTDAAGQPLGVVHRDVSPSNVLVSWEGEVKVADFGVARWSAGARMTQGNAIVGKCAYMSPEQAMGQPVDRRSDLFSLGVVLYEVLTGVNPFCGPMTSDAEALARIRSGRFDPPSAVFSGLPPALESLVLRALAQVADERWASCGELIEEIEQLAARHGMVLSATSFANYVRSLIPPSAALYEVSQTIEAAPVSPRSPAAPSDAMRIAAGVAVAPTLASVAASAGVSSGDDEDAPAAPVRARRRGRWIGALAALSLAGGLALFVVEREMRGPPAPLSPASVRAALPQRPASTRVPTPTVDPSTAPVEALPKTVAPEPSVVAPQRSSTTPQPSVVPPRASAVATATGDLSVNTSPWSEVLLDGKPLGPTPILKHKLTAGEHRVAMVPAGGGPRQERRIRVRPGEHVRIAVELAAEPASP